MKIFSGSNNEMYRNAIEAVTECDDELCLAHEELRIQLIRERRGAADYSEEILRSTEVLATPAGDAYRTGEVDGKPVMTYEDYENFILRETRIPNYGINENAKIVPENVRPATVYHIRRAGNALTASERDFARGEMVIDPAGSGLVNVEVRNTSVSGWLLNVFDNWFPEDAELRGTKRKVFNASLAGIGWVLIFAIVFALPIMLSVIKSELSGEIRDMNQTLAELRDEADDLNDVLERKNDLRVIEQLAVDEYGMISINEGTMKLLRLNDIDLIESFDANENEGIVPALLNALGIRMSGE